MPKIDDLGPIDIVIYFNEHGAPHFHAIGPGYEAKLLIEDATVVAGDLPRAELRKVRRWALANRTLLMAEWNEHTLGN